jgi:hypothetical protein
MAVAAAKQKTAKVKRPSPLKKKTKKAIKGKDLAASYNQFKEFNGKQYTGMQVGRSHYWNYDAGQWRETKITPDLWEISYAVTKRRKGKAPPGSGVPVGTGYHWYIVAHQKVIKLNANDYSTAMTGLKFKIAHKRAEKETWSATAPTQRKYLVRFLKEWVTQLEKEPVPLEFEYKEKIYKGEAIPIPQTCGEGICAELDITLNSENIGIIRRLKNSWKMDLVEDQKLVDAIGQVIQLWYE